MEKKIENIRFEYIEGVSPNDARELNATNNINMWLSPFIDEINNEKGEIIVTFDKDIEALEFKNMSEDLRKRANERFNLFRVQKF